MSDRLLRIFRVTDLEDARRFFEDLGLSFTREQHDDGPVHYACERNGRVFELYPKEPKCES